MNIFRIFKYVAAAIPALSLLLVSASSWGQAAQVLAEVGAAGAFPEDGGQGVVKPDFADKDAADPLPRVDYNDWVSADSRNIVAMAISPKGTVLLMEDTTIREYNSAGVEITADGYPVNCLAIDFPITKKNLTLGTANFKNCGAFTPLNDGTIRIAGEFKGGFVIGGYDPGDSVNQDGNPDTPPVGFVTASGTPPSITDMDGDEFADADTRRGPGYYAVGDRKKVIFFPLDAEDKFEIVLTLRGRIDSVTPFLENRIIVAKDNGDLLSIIARTGAVNKIFATAATDLDCERGRKVPQKFSVRGDPSGRLFVGDRGCHEITVFDENLDEVVAANDDALAVNPFELNSPDVFSVTGLDWKSGLSGNFDVECDDAGGKEVQEPGVGCEFGVKANQAVMWSVDVFGGSTAYRMFQFVDLVDCRHSGDRPCPIINCPAAAAVDPSTGTFDGNAVCDFVIPANTDPGVAIANKNTITRKDGGNFITDGFFVGGEIGLASSEDADNNGSWVIDMVDEDVIIVDGTPLTNNSADTTMTMENASTTGDPFEQVIDLTKLLIEADVSGDFESAAFPDGLEVMAIPAYLRAEECYPENLGVGNQGDCDDGEVENGHKFYSFFAVTDAIFTGTFFVDYQIDGFRFDSRDPCESPGPGSSVPDINETANIILYNSGNEFGTVDRGGAEGTRGGSIGNSFCNGGATRARWSANTIGLELYDETDTAYIDQVVRMMDELFQTRNELICTSAAGGTGQLLDSCDQIDNELDQMNDKLDFCIASLFKTQNGGDATPNCNAFFTKVGNLRIVLDDLATDWPDPLDPNDFEILRPNYEGEFRSRIDALEFFVESYLLNSVPPGGFE